MRCKNHFSDLSSTVGVCASCLRERLFVLVAVQAQAQQVQEDCRKPETQPPPLAFPRSVSPYICRRKSENSDWNHRSYCLPDQRFYSTPQIGRSGAGGDGNLCEKQRSRFSLLSRLFRSRSKRKDSDFSVSGSDSQNSCTVSSSSSPSWFSTMLSGHRKKQSRMFSLHESNARFGGRTVRTRDQGMSPARVSDYGEEAEYQDGSSGYSSESQGWRQTPGRAAQPTRRGGGRLSQSRNMSGLKFCLSPLVRASPNRRWNQKGVPPEMAFSGEIRVPVKPHLSTAASFCANRSRKLADFGRFNGNH